MARVDWYQLAEDLGTVLAADPDLANAGVKVLVQKEVVLDRINRVYITLTSATADSDLQSVSAGKRTRYRLRLRLRIAAHGLSERKAYETRDDLLGKVEVAIMKNRQYSGAVSSTYIEGIVFDTPASQGQGLWVSALLDIISDVTASTS